VSNQLDEDLIDSLKSASAKLTGYQRRAFQAEMALKYCDGSARKAERLFGWGRAAVKLGLNEHRSGFRCVDATSRRGRKKTEDQCPLLVEKIHQIVEPQAQADPKFQTTLAYTRITAKRVQEELLQEESLRDQVPTRQTVGEILNRLGYCLRRVQKTRPEKNSRNGCHL